MIAPRDLMVAFLLTGLFSMAFEDNDPGARSGPAYIAGFPPQ